MIRRLALLAIIGLAAPVAPACTLPLLADFQTAWSDGDTLVTNVGDQRIRLDLESGEAEAVGTHYPSAYRARPPAVERGNATMVWLGDDDQASCGWVTTGIEIRTHGEPIASTGSSSQYDRGPMGDGFVLEQHAVLVEPFDSRALFVPWDHPEQAVEVDLHLPNGTWLRKGVSVGDQIVYPEPPDHLLVISLDGTQRFRLPEGIRAQLTHGYGTSPPTLVGADWIGRLDEQGLTDIAPISPPSSHVRHPGVLRHDAVWLHNGTHVMRYDGELESRFAIPEGRIAREVTVQDEWVLLVRSDGNASGLVVVGDDVRWRSKDFSNLSAGWEKPATRPGPTSGLDFTPEKAEPVVGIPGPAAGLVVLALALARRWHY